MPLWMKERNKELIMPKKSKLSSVNVETIRLFAHGRTSKEVAAEMFISTRAINQRVIRIKGALNCKTIAQLVYTLSKNGVI